MSVPMDLPGAPEGGDGTPLPGQPRIEIAEAVRDARAGRGYLCLVYDGKLRLCDPISRPGPDRVLCWQYFPEQGLRMYIVDRIERAYVAVGPENTKPDMEKDGQEF